MMPTFRLPPTAVLTGFCLGLLICANPAPAAEPVAAEPTAAPRNAVKPAQVLSDVLRRWADIVEPRPGQAAQTFTTTVTVTRAQGLPKELNGATVDFAFQGPDRLRLTAAVRDTRYALGRDGQELWLHMPARKFAILGSPDVPRFKRFPDERSDVQLPPMGLPVSRLQIALLPMMLDAVLEPAEEIGGTRCEVLSLTPGPKTAEMFGAAGYRAKLWVRAGDRLPVRLAVTDGKQINAQLDFSQTRLTAPLPAGKWKLKPNEGDKVEKVALAHLVKFLEVAPKALNNKIPTLGPATGERRVVATEGKGRLEVIDGTKVLFVKGSPQEMGRQHGTLLKAEIHDVMSRILYGIGVGSSFEKGNWFFGEIEGAQARVEPFVDPRHLAEMDALAQAAGLHVQETRLGNFFPELFHCSGFSLFGKATRDGRMYHGRVLDYMKGVGLEQNAVVIVHQPDYGHAWINLTYAGFIGSVTAMNEKGISIGEMGGGGYGHWDGKPMAHLMREVMEKSSTLEEAIEIMRVGPRTCEYYYVISDGNAKDAVGIAATPDTFEVIRAGESHPRLRHAIPDAVLMSAGDRYEHLAKRVKDGYGTFTAESAIELMSRPVCMTSNIQSVLFAPDTLDLWVANADSRNVASATRFTKYNLKELLESEPPKPQKAAAAAAGNRMGVPPDEVEAGGSHVEYRSRV